MAQVPNDRVWWTPLSEEELARYAVEHPQESLRDHWVEELRSMLQIRVSHSLSIAAPLSPSIPPGSLCEQCLDAMAVKYSPAPWGGEMGICVVCALGIAPAEDVDAS